LIKKIEELRLITHVLSNQDRTLFHLHQTHFIMFANLYII